MLYPENLMEYIMRLQCNLGCLTARFSFYMPLPNLGTVVCKRRSQNDTTSANRQSTAGQQFVIQRLAPIFAWENRIFALLSPEERGELLRLTEKYVALCWNTLPELLEHDRKETNTP